MTQYTHCQVFLYSLCALQFYGTCVNVISNTPVRRVRPSQLHFYTKSTNYNVHIPYTEFCPFGTIDVQTASVILLTPLITAFTALIFTKLWINAQHLVVILHNVLYPDWPVQAMCYFCPWIKKSMALTVLNCMMCLITARHYWDILCADCCLNSYVPFWQSVTHCAYFRKTHICLTIFLQRTSLPNLMIVGQTANTRSWTDGWWTWSVQKALFLLSRERPHCSHTHSGGIGYKLS